MGSCERLQRRSDSCLIVGEAATCDDNGLAVFARLRRKPTGRHVFPLASLLRGSLPGLHLNEHLEHDGPTVFAHACRMGLENIVSKRLGSR